MLNNLHQRRPLIQPARFVPTNRNRGSWLGPGSGGGVKGLSSIHTGSRNLFSSNQNTQGKEFYFLDNLEFYVTHHKHDEKVVLR